jgi:hypothetical protein
LAGIGAEAEADMAAANELLSITNMPGGNLLRAWHLLTNGSGMTVRFGAVDGMTIDFGDGSDVVEVGPERVVEHAYAAPELDHPWIFRATLTDADGRLRGSLRFELPRMNVDPIAVQPAPFGAGVR